MNDCLIGAGATANFILDVIKPAVHIDGSAAGFEWKYNFPSNPIISSAKSGGMANYWHGVIPTNAHMHFGIDREFYYDRLLKFYKSFPADLLNRNYIFVPRFRRKCLHPDKVIGTVIDIIPKSYGYIILTQFGKLECDRVFIAAGAYSTSLLFNRLIDEDDKSGSDQITGYLGQINHKDIIQYIDPSHRIHADGHFIPYYTPPDNGYILTFRPAHYDFRKLTTAYEYRTSFNSGTTDILKKLLRFGSPGLISEALFNRFGFERHSDTYNVYYQSKEAVSVNFGKVFDLDSTAAYDVATSCFDSASRNMPEINLAPINWTPALHLHNTIKSKLRLPNMHLMDSSTFNDIGPYHHTFAVATSTLFGYLNKKEYK